MKILSNSELEPSQVKAEVQPRHCRAREPLEELHGVQAAGEAVPVTVELRQRAVAREEPAEVLADAPEPVPAHREHLQLPAAAEEGGGEVREGRVAEALVERFDIEPCSDFSAK